MTSKLYYKSTQTSDQPAHLEILRALTELELLIGFTVYLQNTNSLQMLWNMILVAILSTAFSAPSRKSAAESSRKEYKYNVLCNVEKEQVTIETGSDDDGAEDVSRPRGCFFTTRVKNLWRRWFSAKTGTITSCTLAFLSGKFREVHIIKR